MPRIRVRFPAALLAIAVSLCGGPSVAQESFPARLVKVIVPFPPGSTLDALTRIMTDQMAQKWGQPVVIENVSGGGGNIGTERFARSAPDGYTLLFAPPGPFTINPLLYKDVNFDPTKFAAVSLLAKVPNVLLTRNDIGANTVRELIALAKANPGKLSYASQGVGSTAFLSAKLFEARAGIEMVHVPYRGAARAQRYRCRSCRHDVRHHRHFAAAASGRQGEDSGTRQRRAFARPARCADHCGTGVARFPLGLLVRRGAPARRPPSLKRSAETSPN